MPDLAYERKRTNLPWFLVVLVLLRKLLVRLFPERLKIQLHIPVAS